MSFVMEGGTQQVGGLMRALLNAGGAQRLTTEGQTDGMMVNSKDPTAAPKYPSDDHHHVHVVLRGLYDDGIS